MTRGLAWLLVVAGTMLWAELAAAQGRKPKLPPGFDPGGVAIAILSTRHRLSRSRHRAAPGPRRRRGADRLGSGRQRQSPVQRRGGRDAGGLGGDGERLDAGDRAAGPARRAGAHRRARSGLARQSRWRSSHRRRPASSWCRCGRRPPTQWAAFGMAIKASPTCCSSSRPATRARDIDREPVWPAAFGHGNVLVVSAAPAEGAAQVTTRPNTGPKTVAAIVDGAENSRMAAVAGCRRSGRLLAAAAPASQGRGAEGALLAEVAKQRPGSTTPVIERCGAGGSLRPALRKSK